MPTILLVDDDDAVRHVMEDFLASAGYNVISASDTGRAAEHLVSRQKIDLCLVDLVMPYGVPDGATFARSVRDQRQELPILLMTGYYAAALKIHDLADGLLYKPIDFDVLKVEIERLLANQPPSPMN